jgi:hypothetical protein
MPRPWIVLPHEPLERLESNLWAVDGALPKGPIRRRMCIARLGDGRLVFMNAVPLCEQDMRDVEAFGEPAFLLVGNGYHRIDLAPFKARYPRLRVLAGAAVRKRVEEKVPVDGGWGDAPRDHDVIVHPLAGTKIDEAVVEVRSAGRTSLCFFGDTLMNIPHASGVGGIILRVLRSSGGPKITGIAKLFVVGDRRALRDQLEHLAAAPGLARLIPSHGRIVSEDAAGVLKRAASTL